METTQTEISDRMRGMLVKWLVDVHLKFKLMPQTLYLTVSIIDRYTERAPVSRGEYQLLGVTAMLVACKYEEIHPPVVEDFIYISDDTYSREQILKMEFMVLSALHFEIEQPTAFRIMERFLQLANIDKDAEAR